MSKADGDSGDPTKKRAEYLVLHFWIPQGGFGHRFQSLLTVLRQRGTVTEIRSLRSLMSIIIRGKLWERDTRVLVFTSVLMPIIVLLKLLRPGLPVYYFIRGDEMGWARYYRRWMRVAVAYGCQGILNVMGCVFVFVSLDLQALFGRRFGHIRRKAYLPNTVGSQIPEIHTFNGNVALVGDFGTVKDVEWALASLGSGKFSVDLYGNTSMPEKWQRSWLKAHGVVVELSHDLAKTSSLVVLSSQTEGFPNVVIDALKAGCAVVVPYGFPFKYLPISPQWRFLKRGGQESASGAESHLEQLLSRLLMEKRDFRKDNPELIQLVESDWSDHVWRVLG